MCLAGRRRRRRAEILSIETKRLERDRLIVDHLADVARDAQFIASRFGSRFDKTELAAAGVVKMIEIAASFDASRGALFWTFVKKAVRGAMWELVRRRNYRESSHLELMAEHVMVADFRQSPEEAFAAAERNRIANDAMSVLDARERVIVQRYYAGEEDLGVIGLDFGISASGASAVHRKALSKMATHLARRGLKAA
jgi:RNA polymerase sigma factor (sigma-70 family)